MVLMCVTFRLKAIFSMSTTSSGLTTMMEMMQEMGLVIDVRPQAELAITDAALRPHALAR